jgi:hypothetical protein
MLVGYIGTIAADFIGGWAADTEDPDTVINVVIYVDGKRVAQVPCDIFRPDLRDLKIYGQGNHGLRYVFPTPLPLSAINRVTVRFARTGAIVPNGERVLLDGKSMRAILVTAPGRSGTTLMMSRLFLSPQICVAESPPFEVRLISYWSTVVRTLTASADYERSTHPDRLEGDGFKVGSNPFYHRSFRATFHDKQLESEYFEAYTPTVLNDTAHKLICEYYLRTKADREKPLATFFAEKSNNLHRPTRQFAKTIFPDLKEIVLVRDPRDLLCSHLSYFRKEPEQALRGVVDTAKELMRIKAEESSRVFIARYEDMILDSEQLFGDLAAHLGTERFPKPDESTQLSVFHVHGTSNSPEASIGRWKSDMPPELLRLCEASLAGFLCEFGYSPASR